MIRLVLLGFKMFVLTIVILVLAQIPVGNQRICDHVRDVVQHTHVLRAVNWIAQRFDFLEGHKALVGGISKADRSGSFSSRAAGSEHTESDKVRLSGLLKPAAH